MVELREVVPSMEPLIVINGDLPPPPPLRSRSSSLQWSR